MYDQYRERGEKGGIQGCRELMRALIMVVNNNVKIRFSRSYRDRRHDVGSNRTALHFRYSYRFVMQIVAIE